MTHPYFWMALSAVNSPLFGYHAWNSDSDSSIWTYTWFILSILTSFKAAEAGNVLTGIK